MRHPGWGSRAFLDTLCHGKKGEMLPSASLGRHHHSSNKGGGFAGGERLFLLLGGGEGLSDSRIDGGIKFEEFFQSSSCRSLYEPLCRTRFS